MISILQDLKDLFAAIKAQQWSAAWISAKAIGDFIFGVNTDQPIHMMAGSAEHAEMVAAIADLEACCEPSHPMMASASAGGGGAIIALLLPVFLAALKKLLGI